MTDLTAAPRPVPTTEERMRDARTDRTFATYLDATERDQLDARAACAEQERDEALDARNVLRQQLDTARAELGAAQELLAVVDDLAEQLDRARARYATRPSEQPPGLGSAPPRAQDDEATPRRLLDQAIESALPQAGNNVRALLKALRQELARVDAKRAELAEREG